MIWNGRVAFRSWIEWCAAILKAFRAIIHTVGYQIKMWTWHHKYHCKWEQFFPWFFCLFLNITVIVIRAVIEEKTFHCLVGRFWHFLTLTDSISVLLTFLEMQSTLIPKYWVHPMLPVTCPLFGRVFLLFVIASLFYPSSLSIKCHAEYKILWHWFGHR